MLAFSAPGVWIRHACKSCYGPDVVVFPASHGISKDNLIGCTLQSAENVHHMSAC